MVERPTEGYCEKHDYHYAGAECPICDRSVEERTTPMGSTPYEDVIRELRDRDPPEDVDKWLASQLFIEENTNERR